MSEPTGRDKRPIGSWALWSALVLGFGITVAGQWRAYDFLKGDSAFYITMQRALLDSGWLEMSAYHPMSWYRGDMPHYGWMDQAWSNLALGAGGDAYYPKHPYLVAVFALPLYALLGPNGSLAFNVMAMAALLTGGFQVARRFCGPGAAIVGVIPLALSGLVLENIYTVSNDVFYSALIALGLAAVLARRDVVSAVLLAFAVVAKPTNILWLPAPFVAIALRTWAEQAPANRKLRRLPDLKALWTPTWRPMLAVALIGGGAAILNWIMFGNPAHTGYHSIIIVKGGQVQLDSAADAFNQPFWEGLKAQFFDKWQGLWPRGTVLVAAALLGIAGAWRAGPIALAPALALLVYLGLYAKYDFIWARFYMPVAALVPLGIAAPLTRAAERIGPRWLGSAGTLHKALAGVAGAAVVAVLLAGWTAGPGAEHTLADRVTEAKVTRTERDRTFPCDYLNPNTMHWECSRLEGQYWLGWGPDIRQECKFTRGGDGKPLQEVPTGLWFLHPAPSPAKKRIVFEDLGGLASMRLHIGYGKQSKGADAKVRIVLNDKEVPLPPLQRDRLHSLALADRVRATGSNKLVIEVEAGGSHDWRHLCVGADLTKSP